MKHLSILLILALVLIPLSVFAESNLDDSPILSITNLFYYEPGTNDENPEQTREANEAYRSRIAGLINKSDYQFTSKLLTWNVNETLATDDFTAVTWQVTNTSDKILYVQSNEFLITFNGIVYDVTGGYHWANYAILPGETLNARLHGVLWDHCEPGEGNLEIPVKIYELSSEAYEEAKKSGTLDEFYPEETTLTYVEDTTVLIPMNMGKSMIFSALKNGEPILQQMDGYILKITQAEMNAVGACFTVERIYNTEEEALDDPGTGDSYWTYEFHAANGITWIQAAFGTVPDQPIQSDDGTWAWQYQSKVYYMYSQPEQIIVRSRYYNNGTGYDESKNEDCILTFSLED